ncbi:hypothetical protein BJX64DRAFT_291765 [Aspergillus heterothallicus]
MPLHEFQFILHSPNSKRPGVSQTKAARSHAARLAHAKARRLRMVEYQTQKKHEDYSQLGDAMTRINTLIIPGPTNPLPASRRDPFSSFALPLKPIEERLFDHYLTTVIPRMHCNASDDLFTERMMHGWIPLAVSEQSLLHITFLASCRNLSDRYRGRPEHDLFNRLAFQYKLMILQSLRNSITAEVPQFSDVTVSEALMLAYDELFVHDKTMLKHHVDGAVQMVNLKGGPQTLGLGGLMALLLSNLLTKVILEVGIPVHVPWDVTTVV